MCRIVVVKALVALCQLRMLLLVIAPSPHAVSLSFNCKDGKVEPVGIVFNTPHSAVPAPGQTASNLSFFLSYAFSQVGGHLRFLCVSLNRIRKKKKKLLLQLQSTIGDKVFETLYGNFREHKNSHPSPVPSTVPSTQSWGVCCFLKVRVARTVAQHCMEGMGEEKLYFSLLKAGKHQKAVVVSQLFLSPFSLENRIF